MPTKTAPAKTKTVSRAVHNRTVAKLKRQLADEQASAKKRVKEAYIIGLSDQNDDEPPISFGRGALRQGYRTSKQSVRDETSISQEAAIERSYRQFATNPLAFSIAGIRSDYVWGDGPTITADNEAVQACLDKHWEDSVNDWPGKGAQRVRDLYLYGELIIEAFLRPADGRVRLGPIDPAEIEEVITSIENRDEIIAIRLKSIGEERGQAGRLLKIIIEDEDDRLTGVQVGEIATDRAYAADDLIAHRGRSWRVTEANTPTERFASGWSNVTAREVCFGRRWRVCEASGTEVRDPRSGAKLYGRIQDEDAGLVEGVPFDGQCFMVTVNRTSIGMRGRPESLALIDWLDRYDQMFFDILEHSALLKDIVWDLLVNGGDDVTLNKQARNFMAAQNQSGKVFAHNEKVTANPLNPDLKGADWASLSDTVLNLISGGSRYPVYMLGSGGDANLATATAQGGPTYRGFKTKQGVVQRLLVRILRFVIDQAVAAGRLPERVEVLDEDGNQKIDRHGQPITALARKAFSIAMPEISTRDTASAAASFAGLVNAVVALYSAKLLPIKVCVELIARGADLVGVEIDVNAVVEALTTEAGPGLADALAGAQKADRADNETQAADQVTAILNQIATSGAREEPKQQ